MTLAERPTLSVAETAELLGISRWLVQQAVRDGSLPSVRVGRRILIPRTRLDAWLNGSAPAIDGHPPGEADTSDDTLPATDRGSAPNDGNGRQARPSTYRPTAAHEAPSRAVRSGPTDRQTAHAAR